MEATGIERSGALSRLGTREPSEAFGGSGAGRTVLVIEDSDVVRRVLRLVLEAEGYRVVESARGGEAMALVLQERPDIITLDLDLPDVDGRSLLEELGRRSARRPPVVVISAYADLLTAVERRRAADVIVKPFDLDDLLKRLAQAVRSRRKAAAGGKEPSHD